MTVKELIKELKSLPNDLEVVFNVYEEDPEIYTFIDGVRIYKDIEGNERVHLYED